MSTGSGSVVSPPTSDAPPSSPASTPSSSPPPSSAPSSPSSSPPPSSASSNPPPSSQPPTSPPSSASSSAGSLPSSAPSSPPTLTPTPSSSSPQLSSQPSSTPSKSPSLSDVIVPSTSGTSIVYVTVHSSSTASATAGVGTQSHDTASKGFFQNKGAVAGVFTVVGLVGLALLIALITNAIRRRQAEKFDRDVAEAAAEAAANARSPNFDDDDYGYRDPHLTGYSDGSHGTYGQPPMQPAADQFGMTEVNHYDPYANVGVPVAVSGAAGIGAAGVNRQKSVTAPYNAFAGPSPPVNTVPYTSAAQGVHDLSSQTSDQSLRYRQRGPSVGNQLDLLQAAGLGGAPGTVAAAVARGTPLPPPQQRNSPSPQQLSRNRSLGAGTLGSTSSHGGNESYAAHYRPGFNPDVYQPPAPQVMQGPQAYVSQVQTAQPQPVESRPVSAVDPYDGIAYDSPDPHVNVVNPYSPNEPPARSDPQPMAGNFSSPESSSHDVGGGDADYRPFHEDESRMSLRDSEDYGFNGGRRVLKVANQ